MCLSTVYYEKEKLGGGTPLAEYVTSVAVDGGKIVFTDITGNVTEANAAIKSVDLVKNEILID
jgi:predicted RNA-binding protein